MLLPCLSHNCHCTFGSGTGMTCPMNRRCFDALIQGWRTAASSLPDGRPGANTRFEMVDIALSAFGIFFTPRPESSSVPLILSQRANCCVVAHCCLQR